MSLAIESATAADLPDVVRVLDGAGLPHSDVTAPMLEHFLLARRGGKLLGVVGLEPLGSVGLLRSLAVDASHRGEGLGLDLTRAVERLARARGVADLYLLTTTAERFFARLGYGVLPRAEAPAPIRGTTEYRELCAATSVCMVRHLS